MAGNCADVIKANFKIIVSNLDSSMNFLIERNRLKVIWQNLAAAPGRIASAHAQIDTNFAEGFYVQPYYQNSAINSNVLLNSIGTTNTQDWYTTKIVGDDGALNTCPVAGLPAICCGNSSNRNDNRCCACGRYRRTVYDVDSPYLRTGPNSSRSTNSSCNGGAGRFEDFWCNYNCNWDLNGSRNGCNERLRTNLFQNEINNQKTSASNAINAEVTRAYNNFKPYEVSSAPQVTPMKIGCCQTQIFDNISANNVTFDNITTECTIINDGL